MTSRLRVPAAGYDFIVVGSGVAGSFAALHAARAGRVLMLTRTGLEESNSFYAQGGIAAAVGEGDSAEAHFRDTVSAGRGLCDEAAVRLLVEEGPRRIQELVALGIRFDRDGSQLALGREAAHSNSRIVHAGGDTTGAEIQRGLHQALADADVEKLENHVVQQIVVRDGWCRGVVVEHEGEVVDYSGRAVILAAGGGGQLYRYTTNPPTADASGAALAYHAGAELTDMEFFQFHPTALHKDGAPTFLISEAVRGEGAVLRNSSGERFMLERHELAELAPRDVVAREIWSEMDRERNDHVFLDLRGLSADRVRSRFPQIYATCLRCGLDITADLVPVAPAAHYMIGGVRTDLEGRTSVPGLYACGEVACCYVHGANRLASNSLLESVVFSRRAARAAMAQLSAQRAATPALARETASGFGAADASTWPYRPGRRRAIKGVAEAAAPASDGEDGRLNTPAEQPISRAELPELMWQEAGLVRDAAGLRDALLRIGDGWASPQHQVARLLCWSALLRTESRGAHYRTDHPNPDSEWRGHLVLQQEEEPMLELA